MNEKKRRRPVFFPLLLGAALAYFFDPNQGARRRNVARDKLGSLLRRGADRSADTARYAGGQAQGAMQSAAQSVAPSVAPHAPDNPNPDDTTLTDRVESEIFRDPKLPKGDININTVDGVVELRGELETQQAIDDLIAKVRAIPNVRDVTSYLHVPGTVAPNKESAIEAS